MQRVNLDGVDLEYTVQGSGEPLVLIHGAILADAFSPLLAQPRIANTYRVIAYHRRGFAGSSRASAPFVIGQQAADARALLRHLGITRAHIAGHSYGAAIALQWALDAPDEVQSLALLEAPLFEGIPGGIPQRMRRASASPCWQWSARRPRPSSVKAMPYSSSGYRRPKNW